jgi:hypothetical protein
MALTLEEQLNQMGVSLEDLKAFLAAKDQKAESASPPPPPSQPHEKPALLTVIVENRYENGAYHEQPCTFGEGRIRIMRSSESEFWHVCHFLLCLLTIFRFNLSM